MKSKKEIHNEMIQSPRGLPAQELRPLTNTKYMDSSLKNEFRLLGSYSKKIGYPAEEPYPVELTNTQKFFGDPGLIGFITRQSYIFLSTDTTAGAATSFDSHAIKITHFGAGYLKVTIDNSKYRFITFLQNDYPYWQTFINDSAVKHYTGFKTFISMPIDSGRQEVKFLFNPAPIKKAMIINAVIILTGLILLILRRRRNTTPAS
jgi:hypothetical protein